MIYIRNVPNIQDFTYFLDQGACSRNEQIHLRAQASDDILIGGNGVGLAIGILLAILLVVVILKLMDKTVVVRLACPLKLPCGELLWIQLGRKPGYGFPKRFYG